MEHETLTLARKSKGWTMEDLAGKVGVTRQAVGQWERGEARPSGPARRQIALTLGVRLSVVERWLAVAGNPANANQPAAAAGAR